MEKKWTSPARRLLALLLCLAMVLPMFPQVVRAETGTSTLPSSVTAGEGIMASGYATGTATATDSNQIKFTLVDNETLIHHGRYLIMNAQTGFLMSYDTIAKTANEANPAKSFLKDEDGKSENTYYFADTDQKTLILDHSDRDAGLWVVRNYAGGTNNVTAMTPDSGSTGATSGAKIMKITGSDTPGIEFQKGRLGPDDAGNSNIPRHGWYWYTPHVNITSGVNSGYSNYNPVNQDYDYIWHFPHLLTRSDTNPFANGKLNKELASEKYTSFRVDSLGDDKYMIYFKMSGTDYRVLSCDEYGNWGVTRYYGGSDTSENDIGILPLEQLEADKDKLAVRFYKYEPVTSSKKSVRVDGYKQYSVAAGVSKDDLVEAIQDCITVVDPDHKDQYIPSSGTTAKVGYYYLEFPSNFGSTATAGTYTVNVMYKNDNYTVSTVGTRKDVVTESSATQVGSVTLTVAAISHNIPGTVYVSHNAEFTDFVYSKNSDGTYTPITITLPGNTKANLTVKMLRKNGVNFAATTVGSNTGVSVYFANEEIDTVTVVVDSGTLPNDNPVYPAPGSVAVFKGSTTEQDDFLVDGRAQVQLSATAKPVDKGIDLMIMLDLSSSMRYTTNNESKYTYTDASGVQHTYDLYNNPFYTASHAFNTSWKLEHWKQTRMYAMEEALRKMIGSLQGSGVDVRICISDFGDLDHYEVGNGNVNDGGSILVTDSSRNYGKWPFLDSHDLNNMWTNQNDSLEFSNHLNFIFGGRDQGVQRPRVYHIHQWKYWSTDWANKQGVSSAMAGKKDPAIYTGSGNRDADAFQNVQDFSTAKVNALIKELRIRNSYLLGTNYDVGLETIYQMSYLRQQENIKNGEDREIVALFMSDGTAMQYNYFSGHPYNYSWIDWLMGDADNLNQSPYTWNLTIENGKYKYQSQFQPHMLTQGQVVPRFIAKYGVDPSKTWFDIFRAIDGEDWYGDSTMASLIKLLTSSTNGTYQTYSPYYYFYNKEGKNWWAEAIKGTPGQQYPVINKFAKWNATTDPYYTVNKRHLNNLGVSPLYEYNGETHDKFSTGTGLALDGKDYISGFAGLGIKMYTLGFALGNGDNKMTSAQQKTVLENLSSGTTFAYSAENKDQLAEQMAEIAKKVTLSTTKAWYTDTMGPGYNLADDSTITIYEKTFEKNPDGSYMLDANGDKIEISSKILKTVTIGSVANKVATNATFQANNVINGWDTDAELRDRFYYNANKGDGTVYPDGFSEAEKQALKSGETVHGYVWVDMIGDSAGDYALAPETFLWSIGDMPETEIMLEYEVYLEGSMEKDLVNGQRYYDTNKEAPLHYIDFRGNNVVKETKTPEFYWIEQAYTKYQFYVRAVDKDGTLKTTVVDGKTVPVYLTDSGLETTDFTAAKKFTLCQTGNLPAADENMYLAVTDTNGNVTSSGGYVQYLKKDGTLTTNVNDAVTFRTGTYAKVTNVSGKYYLAVTDASGTLQKDADNKQLYLTVDGDQTSNTSADTIFKFGGATPKATAGKLIAGSSLTYSIGTGSKVLSTMVNSRAATFGGANTYTLTASQLFSESGVNTNMYEIVNGNASATLSSSKTEQDVDISTADTTSTTYITTAETYTKSNLKYTTKDSVPGLADQVINFAVKPKYDTGTIKYKNYLVDSTGKPIKTDGSDAGNAAAAAIGDSDSASMTVYANDTNAVVTEKNASQVFEAGGLDERYYQIYAPEGTTAGSFKLESTYDTTEGAASHNMTITGANGKVQLLKGSSALALTGISNANLSADNTYVYFPVMRIADVDSQINYVYYRADKQGNRLQEDGSPAETWEDTYVVSGPTPKEFDIINYGEDKDTVTPYTASSPDSSKWTLVSSSGFTVTSDFANKTHILEMSGTAVYYQTGTSLADSAFKKSAKVEGIANDTLKTTTVWIPVYKEGNVTIDVKENFYLVNDKGEAVSGFTGLIADKETNDIVISRDMADLSFSGQDLYNSMDQSFKDLYDLYETTVVPGATVDPDYETETNDLKTTGTTTKLVNGSTGYDSRDDIAAGDVDDYVIYYAVKLKPSKETSIFYGYYRVTKDGSPLNSAGGPSDVAGAQKIAFTDAGMTKEEIKIKVKTQEAATSTEKYAASTVTDKSNVTWKLYVPEGGATPKFNVSSSYLVNDNDLNLTGSKVYYQNGTTYKEEDKNDITRENLSSYIVWFPVYKDTAFNITINQNFYEIDASGNPVNNYASLTTNTTIPVNGILANTTTKTNDQGNKTVQQLFDESGLGDLYVLVDANSYGSVSTDYESTKSTITASGNGTKVVNGTTGTTSQPDVTPGNVQNYVIKYAVQKKANLDAKVKYAYYLVSNTGTNKGKPINSTGDVLTTPANAYWFLNSANGNGSNVQFKEFDVSVPASIDPYTSETLIPANMYAVDNYSHYRGNEDATTPYAQFKVSSMFTYGTMNVQVSQVAKDANNLDTVWYSDASGSAGSFDRVNIKALLGKTPAELANIVIWFPMYKSGGHSITVNENFYLVDASGNPVNNYKPLLNKHIGTNKTITKDESFPFDGTTTFNGSTLDKDLFELVGTPTANVDAIFDTQKNTVTVDGDYTKVVNTTTDPDSISTKAENVDADKVKDNVIFYAVRLKNLAAADTVVLDYGLNVKIDVLSNDGVLKNKGATVAGIAETWDDSYATANLSQNTGFGTASFDKSFGNVSITSDNANVLYAPFTMQWNDMDTFGYAATISDANAGSLYYHAKVDVIPATVIYFEDDFVKNNGKSYIDYSSYEATITVENGIATRTETPIASKWTEVNPDAIHSFQKDDRPGVDGAQIYGYDISYSEMNGLSMGSAMKVNVSSGNFSIAKFDFTGTGFDVLSMMNGNTGVLMVALYKKGDYKEENRNLNILKSGYVDTYYGYNYENGAWVPAPSDAKAMYQVPVLRMTGLEYGEYTAVITCDYFAFSDHNKPDGVADGYDLYIDGIRIYDPANDGKNNETIQGEYIKDGEGWPEYFELRNMILATKDLDGKTEVNGVVFLDRNSDADAMEITDYKNFGPNNELYLAPGQSIAFNLDVTTNYDEIHLGMKSVGGTANFKVYRLDGTKKLADTSVKTATDMYYDIEDLNGGIVVVSNTGTASDAILSLTNVKVTYESEHADGIEKGYFADLKIQDVVDGLGDFTGNDNVKDETDTLKLTGASLSLNDEVFVNYYFSAPEGLLKQEGNKFINAGLLLWSYNPGTTKITYNDAETIVKGALVNGNSTVNGIIQSPGIPAKKLGDTLYARAYALDSNGEYVYSNLVKYSPETYAYNKLKGCTGKCDNEGLHRVLVAMLNYGTEAQKYFGYNDDIWISKPNAKLTDAQKGLVAAYNNSMVSSEALTGHGSINGYTEEKVGIVPTVSFDGAFAINFKLTPNTPPSGNVILYYWTSKQTTYDLETASGRMTLINSGSDTVFRANISGIAAKDVNDPIYFAVVYDGYTSGVCAYSISHYCAGMINGTTESCIKIADLAKATAVYGYYAEQYFQPNEQ